MRELAVQGANGVIVAEDREAILAEMEQLAEELERIAATTNFNGKYLLSGVYDEFSDEPAIREDNIPTSMEGLEQAPINLQVGAGANMGDVIKVNLQGVSRMALLHEEYFGEPGTFQDEETRRGNEELRQDTATGSSEDLDETYWQGLLNIIDGNVEINGTLHEDVNDYTGLARVSNLRSQLGAVQNRLEHTVANVDAVRENMQAAESRIRDVDMAKEMMAFTKNSILNQAATAMLAQANQTPQTVLQLLQ